MPRSNSKYFPGTDTPIPEALRKWRKKYRKVGKNVYVLSSPILAQLVERYGPNAKVAVDTLRLSYIRATPEQLAEYERMKLMWDVQLNAALYELSANRVKRWTKKVKTLTSSIESTKRSLDLEIARLEKLTAQRNEINKAKAK